MIQHSRPVVLANTIRLSRDVDKRSVLVVEGSDDCKLYGRFVANLQCKVFPVSGKENVIAVIDLLSNSQFEGVLGIVDADFDRIIHGQLENTNPNIVQGDYHDIETMMIHSSALDVVMQEFGSPDKLSRLSSSPRDLLLRAALPIGALRLTSARLGLNLRFDGLNLEKCMDTNTFVADLEALVVTVLQRSQRQDLSVEELVISVNTLLNSRHDPLELCVGDDLVDALRLGFRQQFASKKATEVANERLKESLRMAFSREEFFNLGVVDQVREWERKSAPYTVLPRSPLP